MILNLVLNADWYMQFEEKQMHIEYREITPYWTKRIWDNRDEITLVKLRKGYTKKAMILKVDKITKGKLPGFESHGLLYLIHTKGSI